jgi:hypothetical protein
MTGNIRKEVFNRIIFAKNLYKDGELACNIENDQIIFAKGLLLLHDATENVLGAIADQVGVKLKDRTYILDYFDLIKEVDPQKRTLPYMTQIKNLSTIRNIIKHQGILPDIKSNAHFPSTVYQLITDICQTYLGLDFSSISLKNLIRNKKVLKFINKAEKEIADGMIRESLISLAYAMYDICEYSMTQAAYWTGYLFKQQKEVIYTEPYSSSHTIDLLQNRVDPYLYHRFKNLTPLIGENTKTNKLTYYWDKNYGHPVNWTEQNAKFCLDFCIDTALKFQREKDEGYTLIDYQFVFEDIIEPVGEEAVFWDQSKYPAEITLPTIQKPLGPRKKVFILKKGDSIIGYARDDKDRLDEWEIFSHDERIKGILIPIVSKEEVKVTRKKRK